MNKNLNIQEELDELKRVAPLLTSIKRQECLEVPDNYFDTLPNRINELCQGASSKVEFSGILSRIQKKNPFEVPDSYFDNLSSRIEDKVQASLTISRWSVIRQAPFPIRPSQRVWAMAAVLVGIIFLVGSTLYFINQSGTGHKQQLTQITATDLSNCTIMYDLDESAIIEHISQSESGTDENEKEAEDYLISNNVDIHSMLNEL